MSTNALRLTLQSAGLLVKEQSPELHLAESPWYVKALLGLSGWLAALCLLIFFGFWLQSLLLNVSVSLTIGSALIVTAIVILRLPKNEFYEHLGFAASLTGQGLLLLALTHYTDGLNKQLYLPIVFVQIALIVLIPSYTHRVYSSFIATVALTLFMMSVGYLWIFKIIVLLSMCWLWLNEFHYPKHMKMIQAVGYGLILSEIMFTNMYALFFFNILGQLIPAASQFDAWLSPWMHAIPATLAMLFIARQQLKQLGHSLSQPVSLILLALIVALNALSLQIDHLGIGLLILLLGCAGSNRILIGLGIFTLLSTVMSYYYFLETTLLVKSQILFISGLTLLVFRWIIQRLSYKPMELKDVS